MIEHRGRGRRVRVVYVRKRTGDVGEPEIAVEPDALVSIGPKADRGPHVVETGDLCLHGEGKILVGEVGLAIWRHDGIAQVRMARRPAAKVSRDLPVLLIPSS